MHKATTQSPTPPSTPAAPSQVDPTTAQALAAYLTLTGDSARAAHESRVSTLRRYIADNTDGIERRQCDIDNLTERNAEHERNITALQSDIATLPPAPVISPLQAKADIARALSLPYIKAITTNTIDGKPFIVATTRAGALYTTLTKKYSKAERWYTVRPYRIALPAYRIAIALTPHGSISNDRDALGLALADYEEDTGHWGGWNGYSHEPHAHWGTSNQHNAEEYLGICLGEYESDITKAAHTSLADTLITLAIYLQQSGAAHGYVSSREKWALWLGKAEYNRAMVPTMKEVAEGEAEAEDSDNDCDCRDSDGNITCDDDCECECHN